LHGGPDQALLTSWSINPSRGRTSRPETGGVTNAQVDPSGGCAASRRADSSPGSTVQATAGTEYRNFYPIFTWYLPYVYLNPDILNIDEGAANPRPIPARRVRTCRGSAT